VETFKQRDCKEKRALVNTGALVVHSQSQSGVAKGKNSALSRITPHRTKVQFCNPEADVNDVA
jgi:hypothetical protein